MGRVSAVTRQRVEELKEEYGLTDRQARYVDIDLKEPDITTLDKAKLAGYTHGAAVKNGYFSLKRPKIIKAKKGELAKLAAQEKRREIYEANPKQFVENVFLEGAENPEITANQIKSAELLGKMQGIFVDRIEIDPGQSLRGKLFNDVVKIAKVSEETEE